MRLNLGCGDDIRDGYVNIDQHAIRRGLNPDGTADISSIDGVTIGDMIRLTGITDASCDTVLINHALHQLSYDDADRALSEAWRVLEPGGRLVIVEADVLGVITDYVGAGEPSQPRSRFVRALITDECEPTHGGKLLRWATWFGERRSLWSGDMLTCRPQFAGAWEVAVHWSGPTFDEWVGNRGPESFVFIATK